jgi:hypothetical protein
MRADRFSAQIDFHDLTRAGDCTMPRHRDELVELPNHRKVGFTLTQRGKYYVVCFTGPTGDKPKLSTGMKDKAKARLKAHEIICQTYCQSSIRMTWDELAERLKEAMSANGNRPATYVSYVRTIRAIRSTLPETKGPFDIDVDKAQAFKDRYINGTYKRGKSEDAKAYPRKKRSFITHLQTARTIWKKWLKPLGLVTDSPWAHVFYPRLDKALPYVPDDEVVAEFFQFVKNKYPNWPMPLLFIQTKALLGCRLLDLCSVPSRNLKNGSLSLDPDELKARDFRRIVLPEQLYRDLDALKGPTYLWERFPEDNSAFLKAQGITSEPKPFRVRSLYLFIGNLFNRFQKKTGHRLNSHMLRKRAITKLYLQGIPVEQAAKLVGMDIRTAWRFYLDMGKIDTAGTLASMADILIPKV